MNTTKVTTPRSSSIYNTPIPHHQSPIPSVEISVFSVQQKKKLSTIDCAKCLQQQMIGAAAGHECADPETD
jgi:hypothetical protein